MPRCAYPHNIKSTGKKCQKNAIADCMYCSQHNTKMNDEILPDAEDKDDKDNIHDNAQEDMNNALIAHLQEENKNLQTMVADLTMRIQVLNITQITPNIDKKCRYRAKLIFYHENKNDLRIVEFFKPLTVNYGGKAPWQFVMRLLKSEFDKLSHDEKNAYYQKARDYIQNAKENLI